jgi:hypothetical protein
MSDVKNNEPVSFPWKSHRLADWSIVGMNHYRQNGERRLFVSMEWNGRCIKAEGRDTGVLWAELERKAFLEKDMKNRTGDIEDGFIRDNYSDT